MSPFHRPGPHAGAYAFVTLASLMAFSAAPTPLYRIYGAEMDFGPLAITIIFAVYAVSLLAALLTVGRQSDFHGRRPVLAAALSLSLLSLYLFATADSIAALIAARLIQGVAAGIAVPTLGAYILDNDGARGATYNSIVNFAGIGIGLLGAGLLVNYAPLPETLVYIVLAVILLAELLLLAIMPETVARKPGALAALAPKVAVPASAVRTLIAVTPLNLAGWAFGGFSLSLLPGVIAGLLPAAGPMTSTLATAGMMAIAGISILLARGHQPERVMGVGTAALVAGVTLMLVGINLGAVAILGIGIVISGVGFGVNFSAILRLVLPLAGPSERVGLLSAFWIESYLAFALPTIAAGLAVSHVGLLATTNAFDGMVIALALLSVVLSLLTRRTARTA